jgi:predicted RNA binding protein YcfA (HicA-like mRNA interferase family)
MFQDAKQKPLQDFSELSDEQLTMVTGSGKQKTSGSITNKDLSKQLENAGFTPRPATRGSHVRWTHPTFPSAVVTLDKVGSKGATSDQISSVKRTIQQVQHVGSSSQAEDGVIDIDKI